MAISREEILVDEAELSSAGNLAASTSCLGNGSVRTISDVVYVRPDTFDMKHSLRIATEVEQMNRLLTKEGRPYVLIGFGRWGSADPWLGIPVNWGQISGARVIVEAMLEGMHIELSQGSHFFHNLTSFEVLYISMPATGRASIDWSWLDSCPLVSETELVRHVRTREPLAVRVDGRTGRGVIEKGEG
jgi:hypothetical protein